MPGETGRPEGEAIDHIKQAIGRDALLAAYLDRQVAERWDAQVHRFGRGIWPALLVASTLLGFFGWREFTSWSEIRKKAEDSADKANSAKGLVEDAEKLAESTKRQMDAQQKLMEDAINNSRTTMAMAQEAFRATLDRQDKQSAAWELRHRELQDAQKTARDLLSRLESQVESARQSIERTKEANDGVLDAQRQARSNLESSSAVLKEVQDNLDRSRADIQRNLNAAFCRQVEYVTLRSRSSRLIELTGPPSRLSDPGKYAEPRKYSIMFGTDGIKNNFTLKVAVTKEGALESAAPFDRISAGPQQFPIKGTPFGFRVEFVYHAKLAFDFVVLKVSPDETQTAALCSFGPVAKTTLPAQ